MRFMMKRLLPILVAVNVRRHYGILFAMPLAACAAHQDGLGGSTPRYYTQVYQDIGSIYLEPTHTHELALAGLGNLTTADPEFSVIHKDRQFYVSVGEGASETFDIPEDEKSKSWGLLTAEISNLAAERSTFIGQMDPTKRRNLVLDGIANSLDGFSDFYHSNLLAEDRNASIGAAAIKEANGWRLAYVLTDSVAFNAGLRSGDVVIEIDGTATKSLTSDEFIDLVWGKSGSIINLKYLPKGEAKSQSISLARRHHDALVERP